MEVSPWIRITNTRGVLHQELWKSLLKSRYEYRLGGEVIIHAYREVGTSLECSVEARHHFGRLVWYDFFTAIL